MSVKKGYVAIDQFRIIAALLVIAVHTSPLLSFGALPDFVFTRILARLGAPFFFAATGFFLLAPYAQNKQASPKPILRFVRKTGLIYLFCIALYLPVNIYAGHFRAVTTLGQAVRMLLVDGTFYHLWYLPAAMLGVVLVWVLLRFTSLKAATIVATALYIAGLLGDSYFGVASAVPALNNIYQGIFTFSQYTRNGLFYAPVFLLIGMWATRRQTLPRQKAMLGFGISLALMLAEGLLLYGGGTQRHDSMYAMLPLCIFFLLVWLSSFRGASNKAIRDISLLVYLLHPWTIVLVRGAAKLLKLEPWMVTNTLIHFVLVSLITFGVACAMVWLTQVLSKRTSREEVPKRAWMEIDFQALRHNVQELQSMILGECKLMPVIKANAYGFGAVRIAKELYMLGIRDFGVATLSEGIELRKNGVRGNILVFGYTHPSNCHLVKRYGLAQTVVDFAHGAELAKTSAGISVHIKVDTGMHRLGERIEHVSKIAELFFVKELNIQGVFTQLSCCTGKTSNEISYTSMQLADFSALMAELEKSGITLPKTHVLCSYGIINYPEACQDFVRPGLALYGIVDEAYCIGSKPNLRPIFEIKATIALVKPVYAGERIGYGSAFIAHQNMKIAVITMGYADGLPRSLSCGKGHVLVRGQAAPIIGNICMDQAMLDVSHIEFVAAGDEAVIIGRSENAEISIAEFSTWAASIPNELASRLGNRVVRIYK